jgi:DNA-binding beta-propeller fold protein YncE
MKPGASRTAPCASLAGALLVAVLTAPAYAAPQYHIAHEVKLPGDEGWDDLTFDDAAHRLFIAHGTQVLVIDTERLTPAGAIADTPGVHGIALATDVGHGYISAGRSNSIVVFDLKTLARVKDIQATGANPDAILYDSATHRVFSFNGRGRNATVIDAKTDAVIGTIALDAKPEFAVSDGKGALYVNLEDKSSIARVDAQHMSVTAVWPISGCEDP